MKVKLIFLFSAIGGGVAVVTVFLLFSVFAVATQDYAIIKNNGSRRNSDCYSGA
ncbi:MAG: hypothetical protein WA667_24970 [Candidatus Nitrosopolaris sp.]